MQAGGKPAPANFFELCIEAGGVPNVPFHCAKQSRTVGKKIMAPKIDGNLPRMFKRWRNRVDGIRTTCAKLASRRQYLRPLGGAATDDVAQRMIGDRSNDTFKLAVLHPGRVEIFH